VGFAAAMGEPEMNGIGGNGFVTLYHRATGKVWSLSMAGAAPKALNAAEMTPAALNSGMKAGIVPGNLGGYLALLQRFGSMSLAQVTAPAIELAAQGYPIDRMLAGSIARGRANLARHPTTAALFLPGGEPIKAGELFRNPGYAATMRKLVDAERRAKARGASRATAIQAAFDRFYTGDIAQEIDRFFKENGGILTAADLASYTPRWTEPLHTTYRGYDVYSNPATSRGGFEVLMQANLVEGFDLSKAGASSWHAQIEAIKVAKSDVYTYVADPQFHRVPAAGLLAKDYAARRRALISPATAGGFPLPGLPAGAPTAAAGTPGAATPFERYAGEQHTTSFSVVDRAGNAVGVTPTLGGLFGNNVVVGGTGLLLNNGMRLGSTAPYPEHVNYVGAGKVPLLNNAPVIVLRDGELHFVFGTPGGETIGQTQFQVLVRLLDEKLPVQEAIEAPRFVLDADPNFYKPGAAIVVRMEGRASAADVAALRAMGHTVTVLPGWGSQGHMQVIARDPRTGRYVAGADPRRTGYAMGF
jgi:gamma-glutamyltranspeptidase / glutathione hydrolase